MLFFTLGVLEALLLTIFAEEEWHVPTRFEVGPNSYGSPPPDGWPICTFLTRPRCIPLEGGIVNETLAYYRYKIQGMLMVVYRLKDKLILSCYDNVSLDNRYLPSFRTKTHFSKVYIKYCEAPVGSYAALLYDFKINITQGLTLSFRFKENPSLNKQHFVSLPINYIGIQNIFSESIDLSYNWMEPLTNLTHMELDHVLLPPMLKGNKLLKVNVSDVVARGQWGDCLQLKELWIDGLSWEDGKAPAGWLSGCPQLLHLRLIRVEFDQWPTGAMRGAHSLQTLKIQDQTLTSLPVDFLNETISLKELIIFGSKLVQFSHYASKILRPVQQNLRHLVLAGNPVGDMCGEVQDDIQAEPLRLPALERLSLEMCNATRICESWSRDLPALSILNLEYNNIQEIKFEDLQWMGTRPRVLDLTRNNVSHIVYNRAQYEDILRGNCSQFDVELLLTEPLDCDCHTYWFAHTLTACPHHVAWILPPKCRSGKYMAYVPPQEMVCTREADQCAPSCNCFWRESPDATIANCTNSNLILLPQIPHLRVLHAAYSTISEIKDTDIPDSLIYADLRHNSIARMDHSAAVKLFAVPERKVLLAGNSLQCDCENRPMLEELMQHQNQVDYADLKCASGELLSKILIGDLCALSPTQLLVYTLSPIVGLLLLLLIAGWLVYYYQMELKVYLYTRNLCQCCVNEEELDCDRQYDAFVSYSHHDEQFVFEKLVPELEREPYCFKLCIHSRDWCVGEWVPAQIVHSVETSRRTIIIMSHLFLTSIWGRMEFRTAHTSAMREGRTRVIIVLIEDLVGHPDLDEELKSYLATNTYLKWGDPKFFEKLRYALPHRRGEIRRRKAGEEIMQLVELALNRRQLALPECTAYRICHEDIHIL